MITEATLNTLKNAPITLQTTELQETSPFIYATNSVIGTLEKDNSKTYAYDVAGMKIKCEEEFINRTESIYLNFSGKGKVLNK